MRFPKRFSPYEVALLLVFAVIATRALVRQHDLRYGGASLVEPPLIQQLERRIETLEMIVTDERGAAVQQPSRRIELPAAEDEGRSLTSPLTGKDLERTEVRAPAAVERPRVGTVGRLTVGG